MTKIKPTPEPIEELTSDSGEETYFSAKDLAAELNITAKDFRRWLRSITPDRAGKGRRWEFTAEHKAELILAYQTRNDAPAED